MSSRRKLYTTAIEILRRQLRPLPRILHELRSAPPQRRVSLQRSLFIDESQCFQRLFPFSRCTVRLWSPYSTSSGNGVACACWNCSEPSPVEGPFLSCGACGAVQPVDLSVDYFQIFGLEQGFDLKDDNLERKYKEWQKKLHPDLVHSKSEKEKTYAVKQSARVIDAYRTLSKPLSRALYLLQLAGIFVDEEKTVMDPELLSEKLFCADAELRPKPNKNAPRHPLTLGDVAALDSSPNMMDVREAVEEASDPKTLMEIQHQIQRKHKDWSNSFREAFNKRDFDCAISATQKMRYYERVIEEIVKKL